MNLARQIKARAQTLGFQKTGICPADPPSRLAALNDWLEHGRHGNMQWMARTRDQRLDPRRVLPGVRSMVVVGMNYHAPAAEAAAFDPACRISAYAQGRDYHELLGERLRALEQAVKEWCPNTATRLHVDTGPVAEKVWAQQAGLGWQGKHSNLLTQDYSSWLFLGVLLLDIELEYDLPGIDHCGSCTRCIDACPTDAITEPYVVDARRCIAYLNIELRGSVPEGLRPGMKNWIFGCDVCQEVCPWNRFATPTTEPGFSPLQELPRSPEEWLAMDETEFQHRFRGSPLLRPKWTGMLRNVLIALGNSGNPQYLTLVRGKLHHPDPVVREQAAWALSCLERTPGESA